MNVSIRLLGGFEVDVGSEPVPDSAWPRRSAAELVKLLALQPGRRLRREQVLDALWPQRRTQEAAPRLHTAAHYARTALGRRDAVVLAGDAVTLLPDVDVRVDVIDFETAAPSEAIELYRGELLPEDPYEPWTAEPRNRLRLRYLELLRLAGRWQELVAADPLDEEAHLRLVREHLGAGRRSAAARQLAALETRLRQDLGVGPSDTAVALREQVRALPLESGPVHDGEAASAPALPLPGTPTLGRDRELARVLHLLDRARIVTLLGPGGVGKTRLALEAARRRAEAASLAARFVDLTRVSEPALVPDLISRELGARAGPGCSPECALVEALRHRSLLLVLDNVEHVADAAPLVSRLVAELPGLQVLCTSRIRLRVAGEHIYDVAPLPVGPPPSRVRSARWTSPAVALFEQAATAVDPDFRLDEHLAAVVAICRAVDGLPLAIELAASHVRTLPPAQLRTRLRARLASGSGTARDLPARQRTIPATIDWSLQLLGPAERQLFARLGVFAGPVSIDAVERVCGDGADLDVVGGLSRLVDQSLVQRVPGQSGEPRFRLLGLLRDRARELLAEDDGRLLRARHAEYVAAVLEDIDERRWTDPEPWAPRITDLLAEIRPAHDDAAGRHDWRTAARITATLGTFWHREGHHREGRRWAEDALRHEAGLDDLLVARLRIAAGMVTWTTDLPRAREHWTTAARLSRRLGQRRYLAYSLTLVAGTHVGTDPGHDGDEALRLARQVGELPLIAAALHVRGQLARARGDDEAARLACEEGYEVARKAHDDAYVVMFLAELAHLARDRGRDGEARRLHREALTVSWSRGRRLFAAWSVSELAGSELRLGRPHRAARLIGAADEALRVLEVARLPGNRPEHEAVVAGLRQALGSTAFERLRAEGAQLSLDEAVELALSDPPPSVPRPRERPQPAVRTRSSASPRSVTASR